MTGTSTTQEYEMADMWICSICKKKGHTAKHHKDMQDIYGKIIKKQ